jgi:hypothetical protein
MQLFWLAFSDERELSVVIQPAASAEAGKHIP